MPTPGARTCRDANDLDGGQRVDHLWQRLLPVDGVAQDAISGPAARVDAPLIREEEAVVVAGRYGGDEEGFERADQLGHHDHRRHQEVEAHLAVPVATEGVHLAFMRHRKTVDTSRRQLLDSHACVSCRLSCACTCEIIP